MEGCFGLCSFSTRNTPLMPLSKPYNYNHYCKFNSISIRCSFSSSMEEAASAFSYKKYIHFALQETKLHTHLLPSPLQILRATWIALNPKYISHEEAVSIVPPVKILYVCDIYRKAKPANVPSAPGPEKFGPLAAIDGKTELKMISFEAPKIRLLRSLSVEGNDGMQVLDFAVFPRPEFDLPIFCANFFTANSTNIIVLDLNPLHNLTSRTDYKEKYYRHLIPLGLKYAELLPWGGKITSESLQFFSPIIIWSRFSSSQDKYDALFSAFKDYYKAWLEMMKEAEADSDASQITSNAAAQHKYLTWRTEKDPGHRLMKRLVGESLAKEVIRDFLFNGVVELGSKTFLDYFPEYKCEDGSVNENRSMSGRSFENRPWDTQGEYIGDILQ